QWVGVRGWREAHWQTVLYLLRVARIRHAVCPPRGGGQHCNLRRPPDKTTNRVPLLASLTTP
ncbi:hypothetical protein COCMIDRAFT_101795, partial [Bipolaris oryzae ATCC 44560]